MLSCRNLLLFLGLVLLIFAQNHKSLAMPVIEGNKLPSAGDSKLSHIMEDSIPDAVDMDQKKVIRVNPLELPLIKEDPNKMNMDSSLIKIHTLNPHKLGKRRRYVNSQNMRSLRAEEVVDVVAPKDSQIIQAQLPAEEKFVKPKHQPKKKHLNFLYDQDDVAGHRVTKSMSVHTASGAYPVYYVVARTNGGSFGKYPLKSFGTPQAFEKYLHKNKLVLSEKPTKKER